MASAQARLADAYASAKELGGLVARKKASVGELRGALGELNAEGRGECAEGDEASRLRARRRPHAADSSSGSLMVTA